MSSKRPEKRKYQDTWEQLKVSQLLMIKILHADKLSDLQRRHQLSTIRKAIQKEKYYDTAYKRAYPQAKLDSEMRVSNGTITIRLTPEPLTPEDLF